MGTGSRTTLDTIQYPAQAVVPFGRATKGLNAFIGPNRWLSGNLTLAPGGNSIILTPTAATRCLRIGKIHLHSCHLVNTGGWSLTFSGGAFIHVWYPRLGDAMTLDYLPCGISSNTLNETVVAALNVLAPGNSTLNWLIQYTEEMSAGQFDGED